MKIPLAKIEQFTADSGQLSAAWLDVEGQRLIATNGHMAIRLNVSVDAEDVSGLVPVEAFELARKELKAITKVNGKEQLPDPWLKVVANADTVFIQNLLTTTTHLVNRRKPNPDDKPFPDVDAVFPKFKGKPAITVSAAYLSEIACALEGESLTFWIDGDEKVVGIAAGGESAKAVVALMPMKAIAKSEEVAKRGTRKAQAAGAD